MSVLKAVLRWLVPFALALGAALALAVLFGLVSPWAFVVALGPLGVGLGAGAGAAFGALRTGARPAARSVALTVALAVIAGVAVLETADDLHFRTRWREDLAAARLADSGAGPEAALGTGEVEFYAPDADELLAEQVEEDVGFAGPLGRWLFRAEAGIRLFGPWEASRFLAVGRWGAIAWLVLELALALAVGITVLRRAERLALAREASDQPT